MQLKNLWNEKNVTLSFEVFPNKKDSDFETVRAAAEAIARLKPDFMSVTYGAGGSTAANTAAIAQAIARGKMVATGTIACPTVAERAAQVDYSVPEFANDNSALTLLMLDSPMTVTAYFGGQDGHTGQVNSIGLPNDEMYRRLNGQRVTIAVDNWGAFPSDIASKLYDIILGPRTGLELVYPA